MKNLLKKIIERFGYGIVDKKTLTRLRMQKQLSRNDFYNLFFSKIDPEDFFFVQIGASDGKSVDPLFEYVVRYHLKGIAIEPQKDAFECLVENYKEYPVSCLQAAVGKESGTFPFWIVKETSRNKKNWFMMSRIASFDKEVIKRTLAKKLPRGENVEDHIESIPIKTITFEGLVKQYGIKKIDFLQIDTEGHDYEILQTIDFRCFQPTIINFENNHMSEAERNDCEERLEDLGYQLFHYDIDTTAYRLEDFGGQI